MKRLLLTPFLLLLVGFGGKPTQWPTSWGEFDMPKLININGAFDIPSKEAKPYMTVIFTNSIEEACKEFRKAEKLQKLFTEKKEISWDNYKQVIQRGEADDSRYMQISEKEFLAAVDDLWPRDAKLLSTAVEVLRQADYPDWKLYSRYDNAGVGDLWRKRILTDKEENNRTNKNYKYIRNGEREARDVCEALIP